jgi:hypothetical protein
MRRSLFGALAVALAIIPSALPATADTAADVQTVAGSIAAPTRFTDVNGGFPGLGRRLWLIAPQSNGLVSYTFNIDKASWGGAFELRDVTDATGAGDLDIYFYADFGNLPLSNTGGVACSTAEYAAGGPGEKGFIPPGSTRAIVFTPDAVKATFTYAATEMPKINLAGGSLDLTVPVGAFVGWHNNTGGYSYVRHTVAAGNEPAFDSSPGPASGLRNGEVFSHQFTEAGQYRYQTSTGIGTITVLDQGPGPGTPAAACTM